MGQELTVRQMMLRDLAISSSLNADRRVFTQALRNINDGISLLGIAEGAYSEISSVLTWQEELAEQSANGVYSNQQRKALNEESLALTRETTRIAESTQFNGLRLLDGSLGKGVRIQAGYGVSGGVSVSIDAGLKRGDGTFGPQMTFVTATEQYGPLLGDFDQDGKIDVVVTWQTTVYHRGNAYKFTTNLASPQVE